MLEFTLQVAATIRHSTHQKMLKKCEGNTSEQALVTAFSGCVDRK